MLGFTRKQGVTFLASAVIAGSLATASVAAASVYVRRSAFTCQPSTYFTNYFKVSPDGWYVQSTTESESGELLCPIDDSSTLPQSSIAQVSVDTDIAISGTISAAVCDLDDSGPNSSCGTPTATSTAGYHSLQPALTSLSNYDWYPFVDVIVYGLADEVYVMGYSWYN